MGWPCSAQCVDKKCIQSFDCKSEETKPLDRPRSRCEDNIKINLREIRLEVVDWIHLARDTDQWQAFVNTVMNRRIPQNI
jgi:hypothetical protein